jgi:hypothetical protein
LFCFCFVFLRKICGPSGFIWFHFPCNFSPVRGKVTKENEEIEGYFFFPLHSVATLNVSSPQRSNGYPFRV